MTTANIYAGLGRKAARHDLRLATGAGGVVLTQEMHRRMDVRGFARAQPSGTCRELATYWERDAWARVRVRAHVLYRVTADGVTRAKCALVTVLRSRVSGRRVRFVNVHMGPHVETGGGARWTERARVLAYVRGMDRLDRLVTTRTVLGGDWNVDCYADRRTRWHGFPQAHLGPTHAPVCADGGTLGSRHVDTIWRPDGWRTLSSRVLRRTFSDHGFARARLS